MRKREAYDDILARTLTRGWSHQYEPVRAVRAADGARRGQQWVGFDLLNGCHVPSPSLEVRKFLRDSIRFTPVVHRLPVQWAAGTLLTTRSILRIASRPRFRVDPPLPNAQDLLVVPGNQRVRVFDFRRGRVRALLKDGFDSRTMKNEIAVRGGEETGPFLRIEHHGADGWWFEEPIVDAWPLPRCPPTVDRGRVARRARDLLVEWSRHRRRNCDVDERLNVLGRSVEHACVELERTFGGLVAERARRHRDSLAAIARRLGAVTLARTHGDFQPGNILVERATRRIQLIDWEHADERYEWYDALVFALRTRAGGALPQRLRAFVEGHRPPLLEALPVDRSRARSVLALFLLEDLAWFCREAVSGPYRSLPRGLGGYLRSLDTMDALADDERRR